MVVETDIKTTRVDQESNWQNSGLRIVDSSVSQQVVAFGEDNELHLFLGRLAEYGGPIPGGQKGHSHESFFGSISQVRPYTRIDRLAAQLLEAMTDLETALVVDVDLWYHGDPAISQEWLEQVGEAVAEGGGDVLDSFFSVAAGMSMLRIEASVALINRLADIDFIATLDLPTGPQNGDVTVGEIAVDDLGEVPIASQESPVVGLVDSGVNSLHPLLRGSVVEAVALHPALSDAADHNGHGTAVASLLVHGSLESGVRRRQWMGDLCAVYSVRVFDDDLRLPASCLPATEIDRAIRHLAAAGVRVVNLSLGDESSNFSGGTASRLTALVDALSRELQIVIVVPTGNVLPAAYAPFDDTLPTGYASQLVESDHARLRDPSPAALALSVGSSVPAHAALTLDRVAVGAQGWPSPFSRRGPGMLDAIKPELHAPGGTFAYEIGRGKISIDEATSIVVADGRPGSTNALATEVGTSFAAPLVARAAALAEQEYPNASSNMLRALTLQSAVAPEVEFDSVTFTDGARRTRQRRALGYGRADEYAVRRGTLHDVVLMAEDVIQVNSVHLYALPIPAAFFESGRYNREVSVALAYDPPVRSRRLDYVGSRMQFDLIRGLPADEALALFIADMEQPGTAPNKVSSLSGVNRPSMIPSRKSRSAGTNQVGRREWQTALSEPDRLGREFLLVVQNINRWQAADELQNYAVTIRYRVDEARTEIRSEMRVRLESARARVRTEITLSV